MPIKKMLARKAVKTTAKHSAHGAAAKFTRRPARTGSLLAIGLAVGVLIGWWLASDSGAAPQQT